MDKNGRKKADVIRDLRQKIQKIEGFKVEQGDSSRSTGVDKLDKAFPAQSFPVGVIHELLTEGPEDLAASYGFTAALLSILSQDHGAILWITKSQSVYAPGLIGYGLQPHRIIFLDAARDQEALWAMEEGLRAKALTAVITEVRDADITATRRLQLAVEGSGVTGFLAKLAPKSSGTSSCFASWKIKPAPSCFNDAMPGVGFPRWHVQLQKIRNGTPGEWTLEWRGGQLHEIPQKKNRAQSPQFQHMRTA